MPGGEHARVLEVISVQACCVVGDIQLFFTDNVPVVALGRAVEDAHFVDGDRTAGAREGHVETVTRRLPHTPRTRVVAPALARFGLVVPVLGTGIDFTLVALWQQGFVKVERRIAHRVANLARLQPRRHVARVHAAPVDIAILEHIGVVRSVFLGPGTHGKQRGIFQQFNTVLRYRECYPASAGNHAFAVVDQFGDRGIFQGGLAHRVRKTKVTVRRVNRHAECLRIEFEQGLLPLGQVPVVLTEVLRGDHKQRLFVGVRVYGMLARALELHPRCRAQPLAAKSRDGACGVTRLFGADTGQVLAQPGDLVGRGLGQRQSAVTLQCQGN